LYFITYEVGDDTENNFEELIHPSRNKETGVYNNISLEINK
jgi:hypothetical protein